MTFFADLTLYAAPTLIVHYVVERHYLPPEQFIDAALHGPEAAAVAGMSPAPAADARRRPRRWWQRPRHVGRSSGH